MKEVKAIVIPLLVALGVYIMIIGCGATPEPTPTPVPLTPTPVPATPIPVPPTPTPLPTSTEEISRSYEQYVSDEMGFSLTYPEGWEVEERDTLDEGVSFGPPDKPSVLLWIGFWRSGLPANEANQEAIQTQKEFNEEQGYENLLHGDLSKKTRFGLSVLHLGYEYDIQEGEHIVGGIYAWTTGAGDTYTVVMELPASDEAAYEEMNLVWDSIEITTPTAAFPVPTPVATVLPPMATPVPPTDTPTPVSPPPQPPAQQPAQSPLRIDWLSDMGYEGRAGTTRWCQMDMLYHNDSSQDLSWPDYQPNFHIANADGNIAYWMEGNYYHKEDGWATGIEGEPPPIPAGQPSFGWVWYAVAEQPGQYCRYVVVEWQGWQYGAEYDPQGKLIDTWAEQQ